MQILIVLLFIAVNSFAQQRPNIIVIMSDDHDNDAISAYNRKFIQTPNIDRLAKEGIKFNKAFTGNSICAPARATLTLFVTSDKKPYSTVKEWVADTASPFPFSPCSTTKYLPGRSEVKNLRCELPVIPVRTSAVQYSVVLKSGTLLSC